MRFLFTVFILLIGSDLLAQQRISTDEYIDKFAPIAMREMRTFKIPASITLGQGILESAYGNSELARKAHNHFGIKCKPEWQGMRYYYNSNNPDACYRKYENDTDSYKDHSLFLAYRKYYTELFKLEISDYKSWCFGLKKAGYATCPTYAQNLIGVIERYKLYRYDSLVLSDTLYKKQTCQTAVDTLIHWDCYELIVPDETYVPDDSDETGNAWAFIAQKEKDVPCTPFLIPRRKYFKPDLLTLLF
jgi:hypothetical protein